MVVKEARKNPLAPGVYWVDVFRPFGSSTAPDQDVTFKDWLTASGGAVHVLKREIQEVFHAPDANRDRVPVWYLFEVTGLPADFPFTKLGFPTIQKLATTGITPADRALHQSDTSQTPAPAGLFDELFGNVDPKLILFAVLALVLSQKNR